MSLGWEQGQFDQRLGRGQQAETRCIPTNTLSSGPKTRPTQLRTTTPAHIPSGSPAVKKCKHTSRPYTTIPTHRASPPAAIGCRASRLLEAPRSCRPAAPCSPDRSRMQCGAANGRRRCGPGTMARGMLQARCWEGEARGAAVIPVNIVVYSTPSTSPYPSGPGSDGPGTTRVRRLVLMLSGMSACGAGLLLRCHSDSVWEGWWTTVVSAMGLLAGRPSIGMRAVRLRHFLPRLI